MIHESIIASCSCGRFSKREYSRRKDEKFIQNNVIVYEKGGKCIGDIVITDIVILKFRSMLREVYCILFLLNMPINQCICSNKRR